MQWFVYPVASVDQHYGTPEVRGSNPKWSCTIFLSLLQTFYIGLLSVAKYTERERPSTGRYHGQQPFVTSTTNRAQTDVGEKPLPV